MEGNGGKGVLASVVCCCFWPGCETDNHNARQRQTGGEGRRERERERERWVTHFCSVLLFLARL